MVGAGTYAKNGTCAVSATGHGELFIAQAVCATASAFMECGVPFAEALERIVHEKLPEGAGGLVAVGPNGEIATPFNSAMMNRGWITEDMIAHTAQGVSPANEKLQSHCHTPPSSRSKL